MRAWTPRRAGGSVSCVALALVLFAGSVHALPQAENGDARGSRSNAATVSADEAFEKADFMQEPVDGRVALHATRVHQWSSGGVNRVLLDGEVRATIGTHHFRAKRAAIWHKAAGAVARERDGVQVVACFQGVQEATDGKGHGVFEGDTLTVRAIVRVDEPVRIAGDWIGDVETARGIDAAMQSFLDKSDAACRASVMRATGEAASDGASASASAYTFSRANEQPDRSARRRWVASVPGAPSNTPTTTALYEHAPADTQRKTPTSSVARAATQPDRTAASAVPRASTTRTSDPIFAHNGMLTIAADDVSLVRDLGEQAVIATGGVMILYRDPRGRVLQLSARRAVIFTDAQEGPAPVRMRADRVRGIYLEGEVEASDGESTVRAPSIFYDIVNDRASMLDAVFWAYNAERGVPIYVRAAEVRQESARQWEARRAIFTNSGFLEPELSLGASRVTISRLPGAEQDVPENEGAWWVEAKDVTIRAFNGRVPFFYVPRFGGDPQQPIIRDVRLENRSGSGSALRVTWNAASLVGFTRPVGLAVDLMTDLYAQRGAGLGVRTSWDAMGHKGGLFAYTLPNDEGDDLLKPGTEISRDGEFRGVLTLDDRFELGEYWTVITEGAVISDGAFIDAFFEEAGETRRPFTTRINAARREENVLLSLEAGASFQDFVANEWLLQSRGYSVVRAPEVAYARLADDVLASTQPGLLMYSSEYRAGRYSLSLDEITARDRGFSFPSLSQRAFGIDPDESIGEALRARGYTERGVTRLDTRHELTMKLDAGQVQVTPFGVARATFYDEDFPQLTTGPEGNDSVRIWSSAGVRFATTLSRVHDGVDSSLLDIHRLRHVVRPSATLWVAGTNIEASDIPVYDDAVDALSDGASVRLGIEQTWQTKRGGPGRWVDVDLFRFDTHVVLSSDNSDATTPIGRFFDARPEYSALGNYLTCEAAYRMTDAVSLTGAMIYDFDTNQQDMSSVGLLLTHQPGVSALIDVRYINPQDSTIVGLWGSYDLGEKYALVFAPSYDATEGQLQSISTRVTRRFSAFELGVGINYNDITSETTFGFSIRPLGASRGAGFEGLGGDVTSAYSSGSL